MIWSSENSSWGSNDEKWECRKKKIELSRELFVMCLTRVAALYFRVDVSDKAELEYSIVFCYDSGKG